MRRLTLLVIAAATVVVAQPRIVNAKLETKAVSGTLEQQVKSLAGETGPLWIGYAVPIAGERHSCCYYNEGDLSYRGCMLEGNSLRGARPQQQQTGPVQLEAPKEAVILHRVQNGRIEKVRTFTIDCELDAGGTAVVWLTGVKAAESVAWLKSLVDSTPDTMDERNRVRSSAMNGLAMHSDPAAQAALESYLGKDQPESLRRRATQAMALRGRPGFEVLARLLKDESDERLREIAARSLPETRQPEAVGLLTALSRDDKSPRVRGEAVIALARLAGSRAAPTLQAAVDSDADRHVRRRAVAAMAQLPPEQSVPMLIALAKGSKEQEIRRDAMTFLGRSTDERARRFIDEVLSK